MGATAIAILLALGLPPFTWGYEAMGDYMPVNGVLEHSQMSLDVAALSEALAGSAPNYTLAREIYEQSDGNSCRSPTDGRALGGFNRKDMSGEPFHGSFVAAGFPADFWDAWMLSALEGSGDFAGAPHAKRVAALKTGALGLVTLYVTHVMELGIQKAAAPETLADNASAFFWDMGWAFYHGAGPTGLYSNWELARRLDADFPQGLQVHKAIAPHFNKGLAAVRPSTHSQASAEEARDTIFRMWAVTHVRAVLVALQRAELGDVAAQTEALAHFRAMDGWVYARSSLATLLLREVLAFRLGFALPGTFCVAKRIFEAAYPAMGLNCSLMGSLRGGADAGCAGCIDTPTSFPPGQAPVAAVAATVSDVSCKAGSAPPRSLRGPSGVPLRPESPQTFQHI